MKINWNKVERDAIKDEIARLLQKPVSIQQLVTESAADFQKVEHIYNTLPDNPKLHGSNEAQWNQFQKFLEQGLQAREMAALQATRARAKRDIAQLLKKGLTLEQILHGVNTFGKNCSRNWSQLKKSSWPICKKAHWNKKKINQEYG